MAIIGLVMSARGEGSIPIAGGRSGGIRRPIGEGETTMRYALRALVALALGSTAAAAAAESVEVRFYDLDLSTEEGLKTLDRRIDNASRDVCNANIPVTGTRIVRQAALDCVDKAKAGANRQVAALIESVAQKGG
jgi:UrcA family protein